jgi:hypothetical protein
MIMASISMHSGHRAHGWSIMDGRLAKISRYLDIRFAVRAVLIVFHSRSTRYRRRDWQYYLFRLITKTDR